MKLNKFMSDSKLAIEGIWEDIGEGLRVRVARMNNPKYREYMRKMARNQARTFRRVGGGIDDIFDIQQRAVARFVLLEWDGLEDDDGNVIAYSEEEALKIFKRCPDFYDMIIEIGSDADLFRRHEQEDAKGNLPGTSSGSSSGVSTSRSSSDGQQEVTEPQTSRADQS